jgi:hypothetical protein
MDSTAGASRPRRNHGWWSACLFALAWLAVVVLAPLLYLAGRARPPAERVSVTWVAQHAWIPLPLPERLHNTQSWRRRVGLHRLVAVAGEFPADQVDPCLATLRTTFEAVTQLGGADHSLAVAWALDLAEHFRKQSPPPEPEDVVATAMVTGSMNEGVADQGYFLVAHPPGSPTASLLIVIDRE